MDNNIDIKQLQKAWEAKNGKIDSQEIAVKIIPEVQPKSAAMLYSRWKNGHLLNRIQIKHIRRMCEFFKVSPNQIFNNDAK